MAENMYSFLIPCYNTSDIIFEFVDELKKVLLELKINKYELILINDGSPDNGKTKEKLVQLYLHNNFIRVIDLAKNTGQHNAVMAGLNYSRGDIIVCMDDDMQTHPSQLGILLKEFQKGFDIVYGYYPQKKHGLFRNIGSKINYETVRFLIGKPKSLKTSSYWVIRKFIRDEAIRYNNSYTYLQGLFLRCTSNISSVPIKHFERRIGSSNYSFRSLIQLWSNIMGFSIIPLRLSLYVGYFFAFVGIISALVIIVRKLIIPTWIIGWHSLMTAICFFSGINLLFMGLIGEYIGRMFMGLNRAPQYVIREILQREEEI